jgi:hypothetical protein
VVPPRLLVLLNVSIGPIWCGEMGAAPRGDELPALSFFDEDDEPRRTTPRPRRGRPSGGGVATDSQTLMIRRAVAIGLGLLLIILLGFVVKTCQKSRHDSALEDYNRQISAIGDDSARQVGAPFFQLLTEGGSPQDLQTNISSYRVQAEQQYDQAAKLSVPGDMKGAQQSALIALEWRRDALEKIAGEIRTALGDQGDATDAAIKSIAGQMEVFLASDVAWKTRVVPFIKNSLDESKIGGQRIGSSEFLPDISWLQPQTIATVLDQQLSSGSGGSGQPTGPGLHGTGIDSTTYGDTTLQPGTTNRLTFQPNQPFVIKFTNQGENDEFDIKVTVRIASETGSPITLSKTVPKLVPQESATVELPLDRTPPLDTAVTIRSTVAKVPGETKIDNNKSEYPALFSRG